MFCVFTMKLGRGQREIARCLQIAQSTVNGYLGRAKRAGLSWPLPEGLDDDRKLETVLLRSILPRLLHLPTGNPFPISYKWKRSCGAIAT